MDELIQPTPTKQVRRYNIYDDDEDEEVNVIYDEPDQQLARPIEDEDMFAGGIDDRSTDKSPPRILTPHEKMKQNLAEQVRKLGLMPKKIDTRQKFIELPCKTPPKATQIATPSKKLTIDKFFKPAKRSVDMITPEKKFITREQHIRSLEKKICADKRKIWESTRATVDDYDEEEQNIVESEEEEEKQNIAKPEGKERDIARSEEEEGIIVESEGDEDQNTAESDDERQIISESGSNSDSENDSESDFESDEDEEEGQEVQSRMKHSLIESEAEESEDEEEEVRARIRHRIVESEDEDDEQIN